MIVLENLSKSYKTSAGRHYVFRDLNIVLPENKSIGLIGRNGAGKTTLLNIIGGIDRPDRGRIVTSKSISWPVGLAGGFQGSLTGRDNVKFVCRLYAQGKSLGEKVDYVRAFADIGEYFDMPVKTYSSGMRARLSFGLSMAFDFDYYLIDEITAVGDASFRRKSASVLQNKRGRSCFLMASHSMANIERLCDMALFVGHKNVCLYEDINEAVYAYKLEENL